MPIVEANAVGRVVVTSNLLSMPEVAGGAAHLVDPFDVSSIRSGILKVIEDDSYREALITKGFANRKRFDTRQIAQEYAEIYRLLNTL
jgi:glycosyltransferase involved in cell wall biosynthesis